MSAVRRFMRWNKQPKAERPEYPKLIAVDATAEGLQDLLAVLRENDPLAEVVDGGARGTYARVHNQEAETVAKQAGQKRPFPLA
jgi:hypothetical protein